MICIRLLLIEVISSFIWSHQSVVIGGKLWRLVLNLILLLLLRVSIGSNIVILVWVLLLRIRRDIALLSFVLL